MQVEDCLFLNVYTPTDATVSMENIKQHIACIMHMFLCIATVQPSSPRIYPWWSIHYGKYVFVYSCNDVKQ